jgi:hypothetical protein
VDCTILSSSPALLLSGLQILKQGRRVPLEKDQPSRRETASHQMYEKLTRVVTAVPREAACASTRVSPSRAKPRARVRASYDASTCSSCTRTAAPYTRARSTRPQLASTCTATRVRRELASQLSPYQVQNDAASSLRVCFCFFIIKT